MSNISTYEELFPHLIPEFKFYWNSGSCVFNNGAESTVHGIFTAFAHVACKKLEDNSWENAAAIFEFMESTIENDAMPANAACTCFFENVLNRTPSTIKPDHFVSLLGERSKEFCRSWNKFTGVNIAGI